MNEAVQNLLFSSREIIGKHIITLSGEALGMVSKVIVNPNTGSIAGLTFNAKGWFKGDKALEFASINSIGGYAITVKDATSVNTLNAFPLLQQLSSEFNIYNTRIITPNGELLGAVEDFSFNAQTGKVEKLLLSGGLIKNLVQGKAELSVEHIETIGPDVIIAKSSATENLIKVDAGLTDNFDAIKESIGSWKGNLGEFKDDFEQRWDVTLDRAKEVSKNMGDKLKDATEEGRDKSKELLNKTATKTSILLSKSKEDLVSTYEDWLEKVQSYKNRNHLTTDELSALLWKKSGKDIYDNEGTLLIAKDEEVRPELLEKIILAQKTKELLLAIATRDVEAKIESIEKEGEGL